MFDLPGTDTKKFHLTLEYAQRNFEKSTLSILKVA
jgi:ATP-dependent Clp protease ATP-binding subunit ClpX